MYIKSISIAYSDEVDSYVNVSTIYSATYNVYQVSAPVNDFCGIVSGNLYTPNCLYVATIQAQDGYIFTTRFCPGEVVPLPVNGQYYVVQLLINNDQLSSVDNQKEIDLIYKISQFMD